MPRSYAFLMTLRLSSLSRTQGEPSQLLEPKVMHPRISFETFRPLAPSL